MHKRALQVETHWEKSSYQVLIGQGIFTQAAKIIIATIATPPPAQICILTDDHVAELYGEQLLAQFHSSRSPDTHLYSFPAGEPQKIIHSKIQIEEFLLEHKFRRDSLLIILGGGVPGDLGGFVASTFHRGMRYIHIPTTVIAQADSSIGGKTGINTPHGKNLIGTFHNPSLVITDPRLLLSLGEEEYRAGFSEIIKHAIIKDKALFAEIEKTIPQIISRDAAHLEELLYRSCHIKKQIIEQDPRDTGLRSTLNHGHTLGHAYEKITKYKHTHGHCIAAGLIGESFLSHKAKQLSRRDFARIHQVIKRLKIFRQEFFSIPPETIYSAMLHDKKNHNKTDIHFALSCGIGQALTHKSSYTTPINKERILRALTELETEIKFSDSEDDINHDSL